MTQAVNSEPVKQSEPARRALRWCEPGTRTARLVGAAGMAAALVAGLTGCESDSYMDPSITGRWEVTPTTVPIIERLVAIEGPAGQASVETTPVGPEDLIPVVAEYRVAPGDGMEIKVLDLYEPGREESFSREVDPRGFVDLPRVGRLLVDGMTEDEVKTVIARALAERGIIVKDPVVSVSVPRPRKLTYNILGGVGNPGLYSISKPDFRLLEALSNAGRFSEGVQSIHIIRSVPLSDKMMRGSEPRPTQAPASGAGTGYSPTPANPAPAPAQPDNLLDLIDELSKPGAQEKPSGPAGTPPAPAAPKKEPGINPGVMGSRGQPTASAGGYEPPIDLPGDEPKTKAKPAPAAQVVPPDAKTKPTAEPKTESKPDASKPDPAGGPAPKVPATSSSEPQKFWVFRDGKWIQVTRVKRGGALPDTQTAAAPQPAGTPAPAGVPVAIPGETPVPEITPDKPVATDLLKPQVVPGADKLVTQRVIEVPLAPLMAGSAQFNVVIRPGDIIRVPVAADGVIYMQGEVNRPGVFNIPANGKLTLKRAMVAAGGPSNLAIPERVDLTRMIGTDRQATIRLNYRAIEEGTMPDIVLKPDDVINVGTNFWAFPLAVVRQGFRASYGFGFILDRNFDEKLFGPRQGQR